MILLDTHTLLWLDSGDSKLGAQARERIDDALQEEELAASAISFWEIAMLLERGRIDLGLPPLLWRRDLLNAGLVEIPVSGEIGIAAATLESFHGDPADRLITATSVLREAQLFTADEKILRWPGALERHDARR